MIDDATAIRCFLRLWGDPTDEDVAFWLEALEPLGNDIQGGLMRAVRVCKDKPKPALVLEISGKGPKGTSIAKAARSIAEQYGLTLEDICGPSRIQSIAHPRQHIMDELIGMGFSTPRIGRLLKRDHSTVIYGAAAHRERRARQQSLSKGRMQ